MNSKFLKEIDTVVKNGNYQNRTEFIREALRKNIDDAKFKETKAFLEKFRGILKTKTTDGDLEKIRQETWKEFENESPAERKKRLKKFDDFIKSIK